MIAACLDGLENGSHVSVTETERDPFAGPADRVHDPFRALIAVPEAIALSEGEPDV